jgi:hypothetical protein
VISAYSYNSFSFGEALDSLGEENLALLIVFALSLVLSNLALKRTGFFEEYPAGQSVISLAVALGVTYFGFYKTGFSIDMSGFFSNFFYGVGISDMAVDLIVFLVTLFACIFVLYKFKMNALLILGGLILMVGLMGGSASGTSVLLIGGAMMIIWMLIKGLGLWGKRWTNTPIVRIRR